jgi:hypothetical protein
MPAESQVRENEAMNRAWKASDVPDGLFLACVGYAQRENRKKYGMSDLPWATRWDVFERLPVPEKVLLAKAKRLIHRGLMTGCACGCRGEFELTENAKYERSKP